MSVTWANPPFARPMSRNYRAKMKVLNTGRFAGMGAGNVPKFLTIRKRRHVPKRPVGLRLKLRENHCHSILLAPQSAPIEDSPLALSYEEFEQFYGRSVEKLSFEVRKNLNWYEEFSKNPAKYQDVIRRWSVSARPGRITKMHCLLIER